MNVDCFKAYDIRGRIPDELNEDIAYAISRAYAEVIQPKRVVVGHDIRLTSPMISEAVVQGLRDSGIDVSDIGMCGTEEIYFATDHYGFDGGIAITASHNPKDYNGMKMVKAGARPVGADSGLADIKKLVASKTYERGTATGSYEAFSHRSDYLSHLLSFIDVDSLSPLKVVVNPGNGGAGLVVAELENELPIEFIRVHFDPDGEFPYGVPNPLLPENRSSTVEAINEQGADLGIAWDGDFDRCFLFDENGRFIEGYYIVGLLAQAFLNRHPGSLIVHDPRLTWNTVDVVNSAGGQPVMSKTGHAFIKEIMREKDAIYGGEMSAHHYFRDFAYCDSGMVPWLLVLELMSKENKKLSELVDERMRLYPVSGEINRTVSDPVQLLAEIETRYQGDAIEIERIDGLSMSFPDWRFNVRSSNTEPVVRLNVESAQNQTLMEAKTEELLALMESFS